MRDLIILALCFFTTASSFAFNQFIMTSNSANGIKTKSGFGGYIFGKDDFYSNRFSMCKRKETDQNAILTADQENKYIYRIIDFRLPSHYENDIFNKAYASSTELKNICFNTNLAPTFDIDIQNKRQSNNLNNAYVYAKTIIQAQTKANIRSTYKHFPSNTFNSKPARQTEFREFYEEVSIGEGVVNFDNRNTIDYLANMFSSNDKNLLMISNNIYLSYSKKPVIYSTELLQLARAKQPNSLIISDDLEQLKITDEICKTFDYVDIYLVLNPSKANDLKMRFDKCRILNLITDKQIKAKEERISKWKLDI